MRAAHTRRPARTNVVSSSRSRAADQRRDRSRRPGRRARVSSRTAPSTNGDEEQTLEAAKVLVGEGFVVLPYFSDDLIMAKKLLDAGCPAVNQRLDVRDRSDCGDVARVDRGHHIPDGPLRLNSGGTGDHHRVELDRGFVQSQADPRVAHGHGARQAYIADDVCRERHLALREPGDPEPPGRVGDRRMTRPATHLNARERAQRTFGDDRPCYDSRLRRLL